MRILFTIPHFYEPKARAGHGSEAANAAARQRALRMSVTALHQTFAQGQGRIDRGVIRRCNGLVSAEIEVVVCTTGERHVLDAVPGDLIRHHATAADPQLLGYECHAVLADALGRFDYYCYLEDDTLITDPLFFWKQAWFTASVGDRAVLQPLRFELSSLPPIRKLYIDGPPLDSSIVSLFQDKSVHAMVRLPVFGVELRFERADNPHAGCFFLTSAQMQRWSRRPYFLDRATGFYGPLESAATLGIMRTFEVYKPDPSAGGFLEVRHLDNRYLGRRRMRVPADGAPQPGNRVAPTSFRPPHAINTGETE